MGGVLGMAAMPLRRRRADAKDACIASVVARARTGDPDAMRWLYARFAGVVRRYSASVLRDFDAAEDVTQTTFVRVLTNVEMYEPRGASFEAWLLAIARNAALDELRRRRPAVAMPDDLAAPARGSVTDTLSEALEQLATPEAEVLLLRHLVGLSTREVADELDLSVRTVRDLEQRGRRSLGYLLRGREVVQPSRTTDPTTVSARVASPVVEVLT